MGQARAAQEEIIMTVDEYECIRLIDCLDFTQEDCARQMNVARTTVQGLYSQARRKLGRALVEGIPLAISGGQYTLCAGGTEACGRGCCRGQGQPARPDTAEGAALADHGR